MILARSIARILTNSSNLFLVAIFVYRGYFTVVGNVGKLLFLSMQLLMSASTS